MEELYPRIRLPEELRGRVRKLLEDEIAQRESTRERMAGLLRTRLARLEREDVKLLHAYTAGALALERFAKERERFRSELTHARAELVRQDVKVGEARALVAAAVELMDDLYRAYRIAAPTMRRRYNRALFPRVRVRGGRIVESSTSVWGESGHERSNHEALGP